MITIKPAQPNDVSVVLAMYQEARDWLNARGIRQWQPITETDEQLIDRVRANIERSIAAQTCHIAYRDGEPVGTITLDHVADPELWTLEDEPQAALYAHRMIVRRSAAGGEVGTALLDWAMTQARRQGRRWLRLDAWATNTSLHRYYETRGFELVRLKKYAHRGSGALFQAEISNRDRS